jgi:hypothetical protein
MGQISRHTFRADQYHTANVWVDIDISILNGVTDCQRKADKCLMSSTTGIADLRDSVSEATTEGMSELTDCDNAGCTATSKQ